MEIEKNEGVFSGLTVLAFCWAVVGPLTMKFFAYYLYEQFCRVHFEHLVQQHGDVVAESFLGSIMECIESLVRNRSLDMDIPDVDWTTEWSVLHQRC